MQGRPLASNERYHRIDDRPESEKMRERLDALDEMYEAVQENEQVSADQKLAIEKEYTDKRALLEQLTDTIENEEQARRDAARQPLHSLK